MRLCGKEFLKSISTICITRLPFSHFSVALLIVFLSVASRLFLPTVFKSLPMIGELQRAISEMCTRDRSLRRSTYGEGTNIKAGMITVVVLEEVGL